MTWQVARGACAIGETRAVIDVHGGKRLPGKVGIEAGVHGVSLVVIELKISVRRTKGCQAAIDRSASFCRLIRIGHVNLSDIPNSGGANGEFRTSDQSAIDRDG